MVRPSPLVGDYLKEMRTEEIAALEMFRFLRPAGLNLLSFTAFTALRHGGYDGDCWVGRCSCSE